MPRPPLDNPSPSGRRQREADRRRKEGLVLVQIGQERYEVTQPTAEKLMRLAFEDQSKRSHLRSEYEDWAAKRVKPRAG